VSKLAGKNNHVSLFDTLPEAWKMELSLKALSFDADAIREWTDTPKAKTGRHRRRVRGVHFALYRLPVRSDSLPAKDGHADYSPEKE